MSKQIEVTMSTQQKKPRRVILHFHNRKEVDGIIYLFRLLNFHWDDFMSCEIHPLEYPTKQIISQYWSRSFVVDFSNRILLWGPQASYLNLYSKLPTVYPDQLIEMLDFNSSLLPKASKPNTKESKKGK